MARDPRWYGDVREVTIRDARPPVGKYSHLRAAREHFTATSTAADLELRLEYTHWHTPEEFARLPTDIQCSITEKWDAYIRNNPLLHSPYGITQAVDYLLLRRYTTPRPALRSNYAPHGSWRVLRDRPEIREFDIEYRVPVSRDHQPPLLAIVEWILTRSPLFGYPDGTRALLKYNDPNS